MDTSSIVNFIFVMVLLVNGYTCSSSNGTRTLILTDQPCDEMNTTMYQPVTYEQVYDIESDIMRLLKNGQKVCLSDYGDLENTVYTEDCYELHEHSKDKTRLNEAKEIINQQQRFQQCLKNKSEYAAISLDTCTYFPMEYRDVMYMGPRENLTFLRNIDAFESKFYAKFYANYEGKSNIYFCGYDLDPNGNKLPNSSCQFILCTYIVNGGAWSTSIRRYGRCGMSTDGILCATDKLINDPDICKAVHDRKFTISNAYNDDVLWLGKAYLCVSNKTLSKGCKDTRMQFKACPEKHSNNLGLKSAELTVVYNFMTRYVHKVYSTHTINALYLYDHRPNKPQRVSLLREFDRLFVDTDYCSVGMKHLCWTYDIETSKTKYEDQTLPITLIAAVVGVIILLVATVSIMITVRRYIHQNTESQSIYTLGRTDDIELHSIGSTNDGSVTGHSADGGAVTGHSADGGAVQGHSADGGAVQGHVADGGAVPGRSRGSTESLPTTYGEVPGKIRGGNNLHYYTDTYNG